MPGQQADSGILCICTTKYLAFTPLVEYTFHWNVELGILAVLICLVDHDECNEEFTFGLGKNNNVYQNVYFSLVLNFCISSLGKIL